MRIAIIGRTGALIEAARALIADGHTIVAVITAKPASEYSTTAADFLAFADEISAYYLPLQRFSDVEGEHLVGELGPIDVGVSLNYPTVIGQGAIDEFQLGILNAHGGDLPRYRGNACQAWALLNGESRIGLCVHRMVGDKLDSGPVVVRRHLDVTIDTRVGEVMAWMEASVPGMFVEAVRRLGQPGATFEEQDEAAALRCYPRLPGDAQIDWRADRDDILRLINASSEPFAGAFTSYRGDKVVIWRAALIDDVDEKNYLAVPGQISFIDRNSGTVDVITGRGRLRLLEIEVGGTRGRPSDLLTSTRSRLV
jgi:UDP-4-amino-4-deoxy-L-arabinose formyltransferase/UDP-glucuronic acid dehydrogenase (UDP-4-keto-hexauronic acid decarboxylating)